jgi:phytoene dehydrogenase-like protein
MKKFDAIFIGSGHNALIAAAYLARAGWRVLVLEKNDRPGGLVRTEEVTLPGFQHDLYSSAQPLFVTSQAYADLGPELAERGLQYVNTDLPTGVSVSGAGGGTAVFSRDMAANVAELDRLAPGDGPAFQRMMEEFGPHAGNVFPLFGLDLTSPAAAPFLRALMVRPDGAGASPFASDFLETVRDVLARFQSPVTRGLFAPWILHLGRTPDGANSGFWVPLTLMALLGGGMALPVGGAAKLVEALVRLIEDHHGVIETCTPVSRILVEEGKAVGVRTADGKEYRASRAVVASVNPDQLYLRLLDGVEVAPQIRREASEYRYGRGCVQIHVALSEPPRFADERLNRAGLVHLTPGLEGLAMQVTGSMNGYLPAEPTISFDAPSILDPTRVPEGKATLRLQMLEVPARPRGDAAGTIDAGEGTWTEDLKRRFADRVLDIVGRHVPNVPGAVLGLHIISPDDLARFSPNQGPGDPYGGSHDIAQSYLFRPLPSQPSHRTAVPNVYMLGAATWPGHGVNGGSGYIVAQQLLAGDTTAREEAEEMVESHRG